MSFAGFGGLLVLLVLIGELYSRFECVAMPNGFLIGRATVFSRMVGWGPDIAIWYPDGRLFVRGDKSMDFWDEDSFAGDLDDTPDGKFNSYVYVNGVGLIRKLEQPELYQHYFDRKMRLHRDNASNSGGHVMRTYMILYDDIQYDENRRFAGTGEDPQKYRRAWCPTAWFWP